MKSWNLLFRRAHLYLGLALLPWMLVYALSTVAFNHHAGNATPPPWEPLWEKELKLDVPAGAEAMRAAAQRILEENNLRGPFGVQRQGARLVIIRQNFREPVRLTYDPAEGKLRAEQRPTTWTDVLVRMHQRTGYGQPGLLPTLWAVVVDVFSLATLVWVGTGLYLWWKLPQVRGWGFAALAGGLATIGILVATL